MFQLKKRKRALDKEEEVASDSDLSADEAEGPAPDVSDEEEEESAQAKRYRLAKQLLSSVQQQAEEDEEGGHDAVAQRLKEVFLNSNLMFDLFLREEAFKDT